MRDRQKPAKKQSDTTPVSLRYPPQYIHSCLANRYALEREANFILAHFGLVSKTDRVLARLTCVFSSHTLQLQRENLVQYSDKIGLPKSTVPEWSPPVQEDPDVLLPVIDFIHVSNWDESQAEICFWNFSQGHMADLIQAGNKEQMTPWGVAMVRCGIDLQRSFLANLYQESK